MQITAFDGQSVNGAEGIGLTLKERGTVAKASLSTSSRRRAGRHGQYESGSFDPIKQSFVVYRDDGLDMPVNEFHAWVYGLFYPGETERVITGLLDVEGFETPLEVQGTARITAFGRDSPTEWRGTLEFMNPIWQTVEVKTATEIPVVVDGTVFSRPTWRFEAGDTVTRQRITITDRTGHGFRSLMIAVEPLEVFDESQYIVRTSFTQQVFALLDGILYFRVDADPRWPTFIDIYMGTAITNTLYAGRLDPAGMTLDPTINAGSYTCSTESAAENLATPSLSWIADVTGKHSGSQDYTFGMSGDEIVLASGSIGSESLQFDNDVDSFSLVTGVEAQSLSGLSLTLEAGYQPGLKDAPDSSGDDEGSVRVMRCIIKKFSEGGDHYAQWTLGLTTFPPTRSRIETTETTFTVLKETVWEDDMTVDDFQSAIGQYVGVPITQGEAGWFYLEFESGAPEIDLIQMQVHPKESMSEFYLKASTSDPDSGMLQAESFEPGESPVVVFESIWVDPVTLEPFEDVAETAGLTRDPIRGMARVVARYQLRDSSQWYVAWTRTITATAIGGKSVSYSNVSFDIPGAVQVAIGLEPVANREGFADWATLRITAQPTLQLDADKIPALLSSAAIDARIISGMLRHSASGQTLTFDKFLVDAPGIEIVADPSVDIVPISGIGPYYGVPTASAGPRLIELRPGSNTLELTGDLAEPSAMVTAEWRDGHAI